MSPPATISDLVLFTITTAAAIFFQKKLAQEDTKIESKSTPLLNSAFVFVKPHANTKKVQGLVRDELTKKGITILKEMDISGAEIDSKKLIDQHYYAIASKATILPAKDIPVPPAKFEVCSIHYIKFSLKYG